MRRENFKSLGSTSDYAKELGEQEDFEETLIVASEQTAGRGRMGRAWFSEKGAGIYMSLLLKPGVKVEHASMLTLVMALGAAEGIRQLTGAQAMIKWPNDIVLHGKKICGILTEMKLNGRKIRYVVIGLGLNLNQAEFPKELVLKATSLKLETGVEYSEEPLLEEMVKGWQKYYEIFCQTEDFSVIMDKYNSWCVNFKRQVRVLGGKEEYQGEALGINARGELLVQTRDGLISVKSGEVSVRGIYGYF